jgi:hypothetical protein
MIAAAPLAAVAALVASCSLSVGGLDEQKRETSSSGTENGTSADAATAGATGGMGGRDPATGAGGDGGADGTGGAGGEDPATGAGGAGGAGGATSSVGVGTGAGGGSGTTSVWRSYNVTADTKTGALSVPVDAPATTPAAKLFAYQASSLTSTTKVNLDSYHKGPHSSSSENVSWYITPSGLSAYPYVGRSATGRSTKDGAPPPLTAQDLQISLKDFDAKSVFLVFEVPIDGHYTLKDRAVHRIFKNEDATLLLVHLKQGSDITAVDTQLEAGTDEKWQIDSSPHDFATPLKQGDQIIFEVNEKSNSFADAIELAWTIEATVP